MPLILLLQLHMDVNWEENPDNYHLQMPLILLFQLHMDVNWDENPDKQLLSWGGVETNHQYSRSGAM